MNIDHKLNKIEIIYEPKLDVCKEIENIYSIEDFDNNINQICESIRNTFGNKNLENTYQNALKNDLEEINIKCDSEVRINLMYKNKCVGTRRADLIITLPNQEKALIELKAITKLTSENLKQLQYYMDNFNINIGYLINFPHDVGFPDSLLEDCKSIFKYSYLDGSNNDEKILSDRQIRSNKNIINKTQILKVEKCKESENINQINSIKSIFTPIKELNIPIIKSNSVNKNLFKDIDTNENNINKYGITKSGSICKICLKSRSGFCKIHLNQKL